MPAQTRLNSSQVTPLKGAVIGPFASTILRDYNSAVDHGNGLSNAIASAILDCGILVPCSIVIPPRYGTGEAVPGYQLNYTSPAVTGTTPGNIAIFDQRYGEARMFINASGFPEGLVKSPMGWLYNYSSRAAQNARLSSFYIREWSLDGGNSQQTAALGYSDKTTWAGVLSNEISHSQGQHLNFAIGGQRASIGDTVGIANSIACYGGLTTEGDQGCRAIDNIVAQGNVEYSGPLTGSASTGATSLTVAPTQGANTQGAGRFLVRTNAGTTTGTIAAIVNTYNSTTITGSGTAWPVSALIAQLGNDLNTPGVATVTPTNFSVGSLSVMSTTSLVCVADQESFEMLLPTAVTPTTFTANFVKIHTNNAVITVGGLCGYLFDLTADDMTNATYPAKSQSITGTLHFAWPIMSANSPTSISLWVTAVGGWQNLTSRFNVNTANGYVLYPFAEVTSVQKNGGLTNTLTLGPNNAAWTSGDIVSEFIYPAVHYEFGNTLIESYYPNITGANGFSLTYNIPLQGNESMMSFANNTPASFYSSSGGAYRSPLGVHISGPTIKALTVDTPGDIATIAVGCTTCYASPSIIAVGNAIYYDFLTYEQGNKRWNLSSNVNSTHYYFGASQFYTPFPNVYIGNDANAHGFIGTQQLRSNLAANSDSSGELDFVNVTAVTRPIQGAYASHPECRAHPDFDAGATNRFWITYAAASFTVNFANPVTGVVSYSCAARN